MCRLFGLTAGTREVAATFWLLEAPDSLSSQSRRDPDGTGLGWFDADGAPHVEKQPIAAFEDRAFAAEARDRRSSTFVAHVRLASAGPVAMRNTHPFEQAGRLFAHNGGFGGTDRLDRELGQAMSLVAGDTDSERFFALITRETEAAGGDVGEGIRRAVTWIDRELPVIALNFVLITPGELWALRSPDLDTLFVLERPAGGRSSARHLEHSSRPGTVRVRSDDLAGAPAVVVASEPMDEDPGWREIESGQLIHVDRRLTVSTTTILARPPARR